MFRGLRTDFWRNLAALRVQIARKFHMWAIYPYCGAALAPQRNLAKLYATNM
jgi:hypothetical protein